MLNLFGSSPDERKEFCDSPCYRKDKNTSSSTQSTRNADKAPNKMDSKKVAIKRGRKRIYSISSSEDDFFPSSTGSSSENESDLPLPPAVTAITSNQEVKRENEGKKLQEDNPADIKTNNMKVVISPLNDDKIRKINKNNAKPMLTKACQTEVHGLTWIVDFDQIDFCAEKFEKLRILLNSGTARHISNNARSEGTLQKSADKARAERTSTNRQDFEGIELPNRAAIHLSLNLHPMLSPINPLPNLTEQEGTVSDNSSCRNHSEETLSTGGLDKVEAISKHSEDHSARDRMKPAVKKISSKFRIPKITKKIPSSSPQAVTSSTQSASDANIKDNEKNMVRFSSPLCNDPTQQTVLNETQRPTASYGSDNRVINEYLDDEHDGRKFSKPSSLLSDREIHKRKFLVPDTCETGRNNSPASANPISFANAFNANYPTLPENKIEETNRSSAQNGKAHTSIQFSALPDRSEMTKVTRTIRNDLSDPPSLPHNPQPVLNNAQPLSEFLNFGMYNTNQSNVSRRYTNYSETDTKPPVNNDGMFTINCMNSAGLPNGMNEFLMVLWDQFKQQQHHQLLNQPATVAVPSMKNHIEAGQSSAFGQTFPQMKPSIGPSETLRSSEEIEMICYLLGCYDFLNEKCFKTHCRYSHVPPKDEEVFQKLLVQNRDFITATYRFVASRDDLFIKYFPMYANVMGRNNMRHQLVTAIPDCEQPKRPIHYYRFIVEGLKMSGTSPVQAMQIILEKHTKKNYRQISVLIELIIETGDGIPTFLQWLDEFLSVKGYHYEIAAVNRLLENFIISERHPKGVLIFLSKLVLKVEAGKESVVNVRALLEFVKKAGQVPDMVVDVEEIVKKYANVVVP